MATDSDGLGSLGDPVLLNKMDKLREKGIGEYIALPQVWRCLPLNLASSVWLIDLPLL